MSAPRKVCVVFLALGIALITGVGARAHRAQEPVARQAAPVEAQGHKEPQPATIPPTITPAPAQVPVVTPAAPRREWLVPRWILVGILSRESRSYLDENDRVVYVDRRRGADGERGPTQIMYGT